MVNCSTNIDNIITDFNGMSDFFIMAQRQFSDTRKMDPLKTVMITYFEDKYTQAFQRPRAWRPVAIIVRLRRVKKMSLLPLKSLITGDT